MIFSVSYDYVIIIFLFMLNLSWKVNKIEGMFLNCNSFLNFRYDIEFFILNIVFYFSFIFNGIFDCDVK